jgi:hypothetical protein
VHEMAGGNNWSSAHCRSMCDVEASLEMVSLPVFFLVGPTQHHTLFYDAETETPRDTLR